MNITDSLSIVFIAITGITLYHFYLATGKNLLILILLAVIGLTHAILASKQFFLNAEAFPPRLIFLLSPGLLLIILAFVTKKGRQIITDLNLEVSTNLHMVRVPVEVVLFLLASRELVPESMTFEGRNFDIFSGLTAPLIAYYGFRKQKLSKRSMIAWNIICLLLVLQVVVTGILSAPTPFQQLSFDQPNVGVLMFPFVWLPGLIVPIVIFCHLATLKRLL